MRFAERQIFLSLKSQGLAEAKSSWATARVRPYIDLLNPAFFTKKNAESRLGARRSYWLNSTFYFREKAPMPERYPLLYTSTV